MSAPSSPSPPRFVKCPACGTRLQVHAEDAGRRASCRACGKEFRLGGVPSASAPAAAPAPKEPPPTRPAPVPRSAPPIKTPVIDNAHLHPVSCEVCQTLMYATDAEVGQLVKCPDCGHRNRAKRREAKRPTQQVLVPDGDEYQLDEASAPVSTYVYTPVEEREKQFRAAARARLGMRLPEPPQDAEFDDERSHGKAKESGRMPEWRRRPAPADPRRPAIPVVQGLLRMMFTSEVMLRWMGLSMVLTVMLFLILNVVNAVGNAAVMYMPLFASGCMLAGAWVMSAAPLLVAIVTQSTDGADELHDPPSWMAFDVAEAAFIVTAVMISALPAWLASKAAAAALPWEQQLAIGAAVWLVIFPFVILSALEQGSAVAIFSPRVAASLVRCFLPWATFYIVSTLAVAPAGGLAYFLFSRANLFALLPIPWLTVALILLYMRLIGRLGWWIADVMPPSNDVAEE
ncbi:hypothetical protein I41_09630 [Lacipirellula limnantheis]|uniref:Uncharacterized protein n=2 Tax=Lacipirellula limnantheis TaxID=2528024 RepID=A0A517TTU5_9BACT|nr:hypothetical protein I41_09630 [Lacipirellula limnantheis]